MGKVQSSAFHSAAAALPAPLEPAVRRWRDDVCERHGERGEGLLDDADPSLARLVACSEFAAGVLLRDVELLAEAAGGLELPTAEALAAETAGLFDGKPDRPAFLRRMRQTRNRHLVRVLWQEIIAGKDVAPSLESLSLLAEGCIDAAVRQARLGLVRRFGEPVADGRSQPLIVLAMGKLGGRELNFSSDVDLVFLYPNDCETQEGREISAHEFFGKLVREAVTLLEETTADGFVYRVDTRLRPFGQSGPPVLSFAAFERYLVEHGRGWERYAYLKARPITASAALPAADRLLREVVRPFVYRRYLDFGVFESLREMQALIAAEVRRRDMAENIKLGPGGIREIEFIAQSLQLVRGGSVPELQTTALRAALSAAADCNDLTRGDAERLIEAYDFLRRLENLLQGVRDRQVHELPADETERQRLAFGAHYPDWPALHEAVCAQRAFVGAQFQAIGIRDAGSREADERRRSLEALWSARAPAEEWRSRLEALGEAQAGAVARIVEDFARSASLYRIDAVSGRRLRHFMANVLAALPRCRDSAAALRRVLDIAYSVLRRSAYLALLNENPQALERLLDLCDSSAYLASELAQYPALLDELIDPRVLEEAPVSGEFEAELGARLEDVDDDDIERRSETLAAFKRAALFRIAVADYGGSLPVMKVSDRLTELAEMILREALLLAQADLALQFGTPGYEAGGRRHTAELGIVAYGKLAGFELSYSSDLDIVFVHDSRGDNEQTSGPRAIDNAVYFSRLVRRLVHLLTAQTPAGALYEVDTRLRPSGRSGLLVTSIEAFERYQEENAWTWEHQALLRSRPIAGSATVAREFERIREQTLRYRVRRDRLREDVLEMRARMRAELDKSDDEHFDLKQGRGGIGDVEFLVQYLVLRHAGEHPALIHYTDNVRQLDSLAAAGCLGAESALRLQDIYCRYRARLNSLALDERPPYAAPCDFAAEREDVAAEWQSVFGDPPP